MIYGALQFGGANGDGSLFRINIDGSGFTVLHEFDGTDGANLFDPPLLVPPSHSSHPLLVGPTLVGGANNDGVIYRMNLDGSGFAVLHEFDGNDGAHPRDVVTLDNGTLYGQAQFGGASDLGTLWKLDGTGFTVLHEFTGGIDGGQPGQQLLVYHNKLFGVTSSGGVSGYGCIFSLWPNGDDFTVLQQLNSTTGEAAAGLTSYNGLLYGTAGGGGAYGGGTAFTIVPK
ncbi:MAG TPA: choice-of-anchor tandem repeat GloVer-containing protein [Chthonomonadaceae bacterium]|nr:choice-of-anchor tandem repeat GloVer-containing protein [Chthonomonadaceae bacterium]